MASDCLSRHSVRRGSSPTARGVRVVSRVASTPTPWSYTRSEIRFPARVLCVSHRKAEASKARVNFTGVKASVVAARRPLWRTGGGRCRGGYLRLRRGSRAGRGAGGTGPRPRARLSELSDARARAAPRARPPRASDGDGVTNTAGSALTTFNTAGVRFRRNFVISKTLRRK